MTSASSRPGLVALLDLLRNRGATLATAESLTGGQLAALVTAVPGASSVFRGGVVAYASDVKVSVLGVPTSVVAHDGVVSGSCATAMASGVRRLLGATYAISTTGVAGPDPQEGHPIGTVFIGLAGPAGSVALPLALAGSRAEIQEQVCVDALDAMLRYLPGEDSSLG